MNKKEFKSLISEAVTPVIRKIIRHELKKAFNDMLQETAPEAINEYNKVVKTAPRKKTAYSISDIFAETKPFTNDELAEDRVISELNHQNPRSENILSDRDLINETIDNNDDIADVQKNVAKAMTKDYTELMKHMNKKRGASRSRNYI